MRRPQRRPLTHATSREALRAFDPATVDGRILAYVERQGGATVTDLEDALGLPHQTASAQVSHLATAGDLHATEDRRPSHSGRACIVWAIGAGPRVPAFVPPNDPEEQLRMFPVGPASAKKQSGDVWDL